MDKKIIEFPVIENDIMQVGRFTIARVKTEDGLSAVGISRCAEGDKYNKDMGEKIAKGRAYKSLDNKRNKKKSYNMFTG